MTAENKRTKRQCRVELLLSFLPSILVTPLFVFVGSSSTVAFIAFIPIMLLYYATLPLMVVWHHEICQRDLEWRLEKQGDAFSLARQSRVVAVFHSDEISNIVYYRATPAIDRILGVPLLNYFIVEIVVQNVGVIRISNMSFRHPGDLIKMFPMTSIKWKFSLNLASKARQPYWSPVTETGFPPV